MRQHNTISIIMFFMFLLVPLNLLCAGDETKNIKIATINFEEESEEVLFYEDDDEVSIVTFSGIEDKDEIEITLPKGVKFATKEEAINIDNKILASETGLSIEIVTKAMLFQEYFQEYSDKLFTKYPEQISSIYLDGNLSSQKGRITFTDNVPDELLISTNKYIANSKIILKGGGKISMNEHKKRALITTESLVALGYDNIIVFYDFKKNLMDISIKLNKEAEEPVKANLLNSIQENMLKSKLSSKSIDFLEKDLKLTIQRGTDPIIMFDSRRTLGGSQINRFNSLNCTSSWSMIVPGHGLGALTAAHCMFLFRRDKIARHARGGRIISTHPMRIMKTALGISSRVGFDVGVFDTLGIRDGFRFWANENQVRHVWRKKSTNTMTGARVCRYGRSSNRRFCNHIVIGGRSKYSNRNTFWEQNFKRHS